MLKTITTHYVDDEGNKKVRETTLKDSVDAVIKFKDFFGKSLFDDSTIDNIEFGIEFAYVASYPKVYDKMSFNEFESQFSMSELVPLTKGAGEVLKTMVDATNEISKN